MEAAPKKTMMEEAKRTLGVSVGFSFRGSPKLSVFVEMSDHALNLSILDEMVVFSINKANGEHIQVFVDVVLNPFSFR